jgi:hypothetical protein
MTRYTVDGGCYGEGDAWHDHVFDCIRRDECPKCGSENVKGVGGGVEEEPTFTAWQDIDCLECSYQYGWVV